MVLRRCLSNPLCSRLGDKFEFTSEELLIHVTKVLILVWVVPALVCLTVYHTMVEASGAPSAS